MSGQVSWLAGHRLPAWPSRRSFASDRYNGSSANRLQLRGQLRHCLAAHRPRALCYVSCDLETLGRDLAVLVEKGYRVIQAAAYDMHPHTPHVEALVVLAAQ